LYCVPFIFFYFPLCTKNTLVKKMSKRIYSRAQLRDLGDDIDLAATAKAFVAETTGPAEVGEIYTVVNEAKRRLVEFADEVALAKVDRYGQTFVCTKCTKELSTTRRMAGHQGDWQSVYYSQVCPANVCYDCAISSPTHCPQC
jgi:hypothetical protein